MREHFRRATVVLTVCSLTTFLGLVGLTGVASAQTWTPTGSMSYARGGHQATALLDGRVLVSGGYDGGSGAVAQSEILDPTTGTWSTTGSNVSPQADHTATLLEDGRVLAVGGTPGSSSCSSDNTAELYDPGTGTWSATGSLPAAAGTGHTAVRLLDGRVLVAGGGNRCGGVFNTAALYDPGTGTWSATGTMTTPRQFHSAALLSDGRVLVAGGSPGSPFPCLASAEIYDPTTGMWTATGSMPTARVTGGNGYVQPYLANLPNGVLAAGGISGPTLCFTGGGAPTAAAEVFDPGTGTWSPTTPMSVARGYTTLTTLDDGTVLVAGGAQDFAGTNVHSSVELFDPVSGTWSPTATLNAPRRSHTSTLLADGRVLVAGGGDASGSNLIAEIFEPNHSPDCSGAVPSVSTLWPPKHELVPMTVEGVTDPDGDSVTIEVASIHQDEPTTGTGPDDLTPDGFGVGTSTAQLRAERTDSGDGRVYHVAFTADDGEGGSCLGEVTVGVPHDQGKGKVPVDGGALFDSTI
jgi:hypothetical protein